MIRNQKSYLILTGFIIMTMFTVSPVNAGALWNRYSGNPVLHTGVAGTHDAGGAGEPSVLYHNNNYMMWYTGADSIGWQQIALAVSEDGLNWEKQGIVFGPSMTDRFDRVAVKDADVHRINGKFLMWYSGFDGETWRIGQAESSDGIQWERVVGSEPDESIFPLGESEDRFDYLEAKGPSMVMQDGIYYLYYHGTNNPLYRYIGLVTSADGVTWNKVDGDAPYDSVFSLGADGFDDGQVWSPSVIYDEENHTYRMWYTGTHYCVTCIIYSVGYATSPDGLNWERHGRVVKRANNLDWDGVNVFDPAIIRKDSDYVLYYGGTNGFSTHIGSAFAKTFALGFEPEILEFGDVLLDEKEIVSFIIINEGVHDLNLENVTVDDPTISLIKTPDMSAALRPAQEQLVTIAFQPVSYESLETVVAFHAAETSETHDLAVSGKGNIQALQLTDRALLTGEEHDLSLSLKNPTSHDLQADLYIALEMFGQFHFFPSWTSTPETIPLALDPDQVIQSVPIAEFTVEPEFPDATFTWWSVLINPETSTLVGEISRVEFSMEVFYRTLSVWDLQDWVETGTDAVIIDVRTESEYCEGHIPGALNIPHYEMVNRYTELDKVDDIVVICETGRRSEYSANVLLELGFRRVWNTLNGMNLYGGDRVDCP